MTLFSTEKPRGFRLTVLPVDGTAYGVSIAETNGTASHTHTVATIRPDAVPRLTDNIQRALRASHRPPSAIGPSRRQPIDIDEAPGVRLALAALATEPVRRRDRVREILEGITSMSDEEAYYWYAKVTHERSGARALRSLRLLLAEDYR
jgi:hypothetical protein